MISGSSLAAGVGVAVDNQQFKPTAGVLPRKIVIVGTPDPAKNLDPNIPILVTSPADVGAKAGFGFMLHRLAVQAFRGSGGIETWIIPQDEAGGAAQSAGNIAFVASGLQAGTIYLYIAGLAVPVNVSEGDTAEEIAAAVVAAINADQDLPVTATQGESGSENEVDLESKSAGPWGDAISIRFNIGVGESFPTGLTSATVTNMTGGSGTPDIQDALDGLGTGDNANEMYCTDFIHGYGNVTGVLNAIRDYVGAGNAQIGLYDSLVGRPFRSLIGNVTPGSGGLSALVALGNGRKTDRANGVIAVPDSANHPQEIAAQAMGHMARINNVRAEENYLDVILIGVDPGDTADRWTSDYDSRDTAVKAGVSPTMTKSGAVVMQNVVSFYHPDSVPVTSNGYRSMRNISILQNILAATRVNFEQEKWKGISIVADVTQVGNVTSRLKARDVNAVKDDLVALAQSFYDNAWIFTDSFTIAELKKPDSVTVRVGGDGFLWVMKVVLSGEGNIIDGLVQFDTSIAVLL